MTEIDFRTTFADRCLASTAITIYNPKKFVNIIFFPSMFEKIILYV